MRAERRLLRQSHMPFPGCKRGRKQHRRSVGSPDALNMFHQDLRVVIISNSPKVIAIHCTHRSMTGQDRPYPCCAFEPPPALRVVQILSSLSTAGEKLEQRHLLPPGACEVFACPPPSSSQVDMGTCRRSATTGAAKTSDLASVLNTKTSQQY